MTQLFRNDEACEFFYNITLTAKQRVIIDELVQMNSEMVGSKPFGYLLYDNNTFPVLTGLNRDFFAENYMAILQAMQTAGTYDSYTLVIEQVVGNGVGIQYSSPRPRHLVINIYNVESYQSRLITPSNLWLVTPSNFGLLVPQPVSEFKLAQLTKILEVLANPSGTYLEITFIEPILPNAVTISGVPASVFRGDTGTLSATVIYSDGNSSTTAEDSGIVTWSSSDESILTIDSLGNFNALDAGSVTVTVTALATSTEPAYGNNISGDATFDISPVVPSSVIVSSFPDTVFSGDTGTLTATVTYVDEHVISTSDNPSVVQWTSSNESILTIDSNGAYTAIAGGDVTVTALAVSEDETYDDSVFQTITKTITAVVPTAVSITTPVPELAVGDTGRTTASVTYNNGIAVSSTDNPSVVNWNSSDSTKASIDANGYYSALAKSDEVTFTATSSEDATLSNGATFKITDFDYTKTKLVTPANLWLITPANEGIAVPLETK
ncbi:Ig-like domain-containing protein [Vibrio parahaemolyticus]|nr:Ig-like domain-containing protein [Vibrio parahaemolyticus]EJC6783051.1 Ig-like domain-containing protein [Vibrio parahaemolyticus]EJC6811404.1 Ig-like domain-containing protein [Vibrio parahaemolyticus]EJC6925938.1 Ig-like domain-containing protein [Vibrio parahaemolyticus]EJC6939682.1 Ig-like domain-containing protein [Vibrio parahaemolyticus]